uniref:Uncharacterized protein n=1 Tax=Rhizophora mucronata TaxID=61149 RepID=A0A2P2N5X4_RHIMU
MTIPFKHGCVKYLAIMAKGKNGLKFSRMARNVKCSFIYALN